MLLLPGCAPRIMHPKNIHKLAYHANRAKKPFMCALFTFYNSTWAWAHATYRKRTTACCICVYILSACHSSLIQAWYDEQEHGLYSVGICVCVSGRTNSFFKTNVSKKTELRSSNSEQRLKVPKKGIPFLSGTRPFQINKFVSWLELSGRNSASVEKSWLALMFVCVCYVLCTVQHFLSCMLGTHNQQHFKCNYWLLK